MKRKWLLVLAVIVVLGGKFFLSYLENLEREKEKQRILEGERLCEAVSALFKEKAAGSKETDMLDLGMDIYWKDIGDASHPLYGSCPGTWKAGGRITGMVMSEAGELLEIIYEGPDKREEVWRMNKRDGELIVKIVRN